MSQLETREDRKELLVLGNFVGSLLESFPFPVRTKALKEIKEVEEQFYHHIGEWFRGSSMLSVQILRMEQCRKARMIADPRRKGLPRSYGDAVENFLKSIPMEHRIKILKKICDIVSRYGTEN